MEVGCSNLDRGLLGRWGSLEAVKIGVDEVGAECGVGEKGLPGRGFVCVGILDQDFFLPFRAPVI